MIFLGDIASPNVQCSLDFLDSLKKNQDVFKNNWVAANLEGLFYNETLATASPVLYNHPSVLDPLSLINTKVLSLANNHVLDLPGQFLETKNLLLKNGIQFCGAGIDKNKAEKPARISWKNQEYLILAYSWDVLMQHQKNEPGQFFVNPINPKRILNTIEKLRKENPQAKIVLKMHWNFDLETIPFPLHRSFARAMIDSGADAVIGSHSHCVQGGERYKNGIIVYGLGNFFFPWYEYTSGSSRFPDWTRNELALEWNPETNQAICHWFRYNYLDGRHELEHIGSEDFDTGPKIREYSPYRGLNLKEYTEWYKKNRRKGFLIPVYRHHNERFRNALIDFYIKKRIRFARFLAKTKLRNWNR